MADLNELLAQYRKTALPTPQPTQAEEPAGINISRTEALDHGQNIKFGLLTKPEEKQAYLESIAGNDGQVLSPEVSPTKDWALLHKDTNTIYPVSTHGVGGTIERSLGSAIPVAGQTIGGLIGAGTGAAETVGTGGAALPLAVGQTVAAQAIGSGIGETIKEAAARHYVPEAAHSLHGGTIFGQGLLGAGTALIPGSSNLVSMALGKEGLETGLAKYGSAITGKELSPALSKLIQGKGEQEATETAAKTGVAALTQNPEAKNTVSNVISNQLGIKNHYLAEQLTTGAIDTSKMMEGTGVQKIDSAASNISNIINNGRQINGQLMNQSIKEGIAKQMGVAPEKITDELVDGLKIETTNTKQAVNDMVQELKQSKLPSQSTKEMQANLEKWQQDLKGNKKFTFGELKQINQEMWEAKEAAANSGDRLMAKRIAKIDAAMRADKNANPVLAAANKEYSKTADLLEGLHDATGAKLSGAPGELIDPNMAGTRPLTMRLSRLANETKVNQLKALDKIEAGLKQRPGFEDTNFVSQLKEGLLNQALDKSKKNEFPVPMVGAVASKVPFLKDIMKVSPITKAKAFYGGLTKGTNIAGQEVSANMPKLSALSKLIMPTAGKMIPQVKGALPIQGAARYGIQKLLQNNSPQSQVPTKAENASNVAQDYSIPTDKVSKLLYQGVPKVLKNGMTNLEALAKIKAARGIKQNPETQNLIAMR